MIKEFVRSRFPRFFSFARRAKDQLVVEAKVVRQISIRTLALSAVRQFEGWQKSLPIQAPRRLQLGAPSIFEIDALAKSAQQMGLPISEGAHTIYLAPPTFQRLFPELAAEYPPESGLKLMKNVGGVGESGYLHGSGHSIVQRKLLYSHGHLSLVAAALHLHGLGPRLFDLLELAYGNRLRTAYVVSHCNGRVPGSMECENGLADLRNLEEKLLLTIALPDGWNHPDFACPTCGGNGFIEISSGKFQYLDFQNFRLVNYSQYLENLALDAVADVHFGDRSLLRGGRYLYQSVPGVRIAAKRSVEIRAEALFSMLQQSGLSVRERLVLDFGCNLGMMMGQYLKWGARWCHGWDTPNVVKRTDKLLLALGCTRFSVTGTNLSSSQSVQVDVPNFVRSAVKGCVISYLAIRGHVGWLNELAQIPWSFMLYEGHEGESKEEASRHLRDLQAIVPCDVVARLAYTDGDSASREIALIARNT